jgi:hypothetical protein
MKTSSSKTVDQALELLRETPSYPIRLEYAFETRLMARWQAEIDAVPWWMQVWFPLPVCGGVAVMSMGFYFIAAMGLESTLANAFFQGSEAWILSYL